MTTDIATVREPQYIAPEAWALYMHDLTTAMLVMYTTGMWLDVIAQSMGLMVQYES